MATIYGLFDPRLPLFLRLIRYIGQTSRSIDRRLYEHINDTITGRATYPVNDWISSLLRDGVKPVLVVLESMEDLDALDVREIEWIARGRQAEWRLLNVTNGGAGWVSRGPLSEDHRKKLSEAHRIAWANDPERGERLSQSLLSYYAEHGTEELTRARIASYESDPTIKDRISDAGKLRYSDPAERQRAAEIGRAAHARDPERAIRTSEMFVDYWSDPNHREEQSERLTELYKDPEMRAYIGRRVSESRSTEDKTPSYCEVCDGGPFKGPRALNLHKTHKGCHIAAV